MPQSRFSPCFQPLPVLVGILLLSWVLNPLGDVSAQTPPADQASIEQSRLYINRPDLRPDPDTSLYTTEAAPATEGDPDLGAQQILKRKDDYDPFLVTASSQAIYTDNVALVKKGRQDDTYLVNGVAAQWKPKITNELYGIMGVKQTFYRYLVFDALDFDSLDAGAGMQYYWKDLGGISTTARYNYNRLTRATLDKEFFRNHQFILDLDKSFALSRNLFTFVNAEATFSLSDPYEAQRWDYALLGGIFGHITRRWDAQLTYRIALYDYFAPGRDDLNQSVGLSTGYNFTDWIGVGASANFTFNNSTQPVFDYDSVNAGGGVYLNVKF